MTENPHKKRFLNLPKYPGGSKAFKEFIASQLVYPNEALNARVEGHVIVEYDITDDGMVKNPRILKGLGHGCDEEAMRLVGMLRYEKVKNRGMRVRVTTKTTIHFVLPGVQVNYSVVRKDSQAKPKNDPGSNKESPGSYEYTITLG